MTKWPDKMEQAIYSVPNKYEHGWNACHDAFMKVINEKEEERKEMKELWDKCTEEK